MSDKLKLDGVVSQGYGIIPKLVMRDTGLSIEAKAIYAYICSYAGVGDSAFPSAELICYDLGISDKRFYKYKKELELLGYITVEKVRNGNRWTNNLYTVNHYINLEYGRIGNVQNSIEPRQNGNVQNGNVQNGNSQNVGTNNNNLNNNNLNNNNLNNIIEINATANVANTPPNEPIEKVSDKKKKYGEFENVKLTDEEHSKLIEKFGADIAAEKIENISLYLSSKGDKYKSHYATILSWSKKDTNDTKVVNKMASFHSATKLTDNDREALSKLGW